MSERVREWLLRQEHWGYAIRLWMDAAVYPSLQEARTALRRYLEGVRLQDPSYQKAAEALADLPGCNAVEVLDLYSHEGALVYNDWP